MKNKLSRRSFLKRVAGFLITMAAFGAGGYYYARNIEPKLLDITRHTINHPLIPRGFDQFKIVQFSDTHLGFQYSIEQLNKLVDKINQLKPDVIFFTGDLMDAPNEYSESEKLVPILSKLKAPFGKFAIFGNHDHGGYGTDLYKNIMVQSNFILLQNESHEIKLLDQSRIHIIGLDDAMLGNPNIDQAIENLPHDSYKILLAHEPDLALHAIGKGIQLQLSGHSHGGQVKIPFIGALITPPFSEKYYEGLYKVEDKEHPLILYVNRGLGTTRLPFRFMSKPELSIFILEAT